VITQQLIVAPAFHSSTVRTYRSRSGSLAKLTASRRIGVCLEAGAKRYSITSSAVASNVGETFEGQLAGCSHLGQSIVQGGGKRRGDGMRELGLSRVAADVRTSRSGKRLLCFFGCDPEPNGSLVGSFYGW
jgi:hypothetical protein